MRPINIVVEMAMEKSPKPEVRDQRCPAWGQKCSRCDKKGQFKKCCNSKITANANTFVLNKIAAKLAQVKRKAAPEEKVTSVSNMRPM